MRRCWWALVVLAAVFAMHGLQCVSHDLQAHAGHGIAADLVTLPLPAAVAVDFVTAPDGAAASGGPGHSDHAMSGDSSSPLPTDFWTVCLAVLGAVVVLLAAAMARGRPATRERPSWASFPRSVSIPALPRPPDLFALCVLRN